MAATLIEGVYGMPPRELVDWPADAVQFSPLVPGAERLEAHPGGLGSLAMLAPPGTIERRHEMALALRALAEGGRLTVLAPKDKGGARLKAELQAFGLDVAETSQRHHRICLVVKIGELAGLDAAIEAGAPRFVEALGLWSQPGVFSWNRIDPGSALLIRHLPALSGRGGDFGCGIGVLAHVVLASPTVERLTLVDIDRRALDAARRNVDHPSTEFLWADLRRTEALPAALDFIVMNPPFHDGGAEDRALGQAFIRRAAESLRKGGRCYVTANRHLPYEAALKESFARSALVVEEGGYKVYEAVK